MAYPHYASLTFWRVFLSYILLLVLIISAVTAASWYGTMQWQAAERREKNHETALNVSAALNAEMQSLLTNASQIRRLPWVHKLYSGSSVFDAYFDATRKLEILLEIPFYLGNSAIVQDVALIFPERDISISGRGWLSRETYLRQMHITDAARQQAIWREIEAMAIPQVAHAFEAELDDHIVIVAPLENITSPRAYVCYLVSRQSLQQTVRTLMPPNMAAIAITDSGGSPILSVQSGAEASRNDAPLTFAASSFGWQYQYAFVESVAILPAEELYAILTLFALSFLAGIGLSYLLAFLTYRPLGRILRRMAEGGGASRSVGTPDSDYNLIETSLDTLARENSWMRERVEQYALMRRAEVIKQLLQGRLNHEATANDLAQYRIPFEDAEYHQAIVISGGNDAHILMQPYAAVKLLEWLDHSIGEIPGCRHELVDNMDNHIVAILAFNDGDSTPIDAAFVARLSQWCEERLQKRPLISVGGLYPGLRGISVSYQFALEQMTQIPAFWEYVFSNDQTAKDRIYYPFEWERELVASLKAGNRDAAHSIVEQLREENYQLTTLEDHQTLTKAGLKLFSMLLQSILRAASELSFSETELFGEDTALLFANGSIAHKWRYLLAMCSRVCQFVADSRPPSMGIGDELARYVDEHFADNELSLKSLSGRFHLSVQSISKQFRATTGETFYNYLFAKRMERACELLRTTDGTMASIAQSVGYENDFSFKRAFIRFAGMRPTDYMKTHRKNATERQAPDD